ncbi:alpha/beta hydrolase [Pseudorhodobacter sp. W20_MBD10_FR17]|uniref:alpha/beta hydrolase n=1 Tax=Pseudorhodobacter sp. W20_MBD10_FR17 TaxID=3240266 RepID=UPI003F98FC48
MPAFSNAVFFCHGAPGSPQDATVLPPMGNDTLLIAHDIFASAPETLLADALAAFDQAAAQATDGKATIIGFSIGAMLALKLAAARAANIKTLILISPAGPLSLGNFLPHMAGKPVFELAASNPKLLKSLTKLQCLLTKFAPKLLRNQLFHKSGAADRALLKDPAFRNTLAAAFKNSFCTHPAAYAACLQAFVTDWSADLGHITCPVTIWHGENDKWVPPAMAQALSAALPSPATLHLVPNTEHYSILAKITLHDS